MDEWSSQFVQEDVVGVHVDFKTSPEPNIVVFVLGLFASFLICNLNTNPVQTELGWDWSGLLHFLIGI